jgi:hypothetical protein
MKAPSFRLSSFEVARSDPAKSIKLSCDTRIIGLGLEVLVEVFAVASRSADVDPIIEVSACKAL